jgi:SAM-dependent methyltransferase
MTRADDVLKWVIGPRVLDVGCTDHSENIGTSHGIGSPYWLHGRLKDMFPALYGIDISAENVRLLEEHGYRNLYVQSAESFDLPGKFNSIVAGELIEHLANPGLFLTRCREHLAPDGRVIITTPYPFSLFSILYALVKYPRTCSNTEHTCWLCPETLSNLAQRYGFKVLHFELVTDYLPGVPSWKYRLFVFLMRTLGRLLPRRLRSNAMLFVLVLDQEHEG